MKRSAPDPRRALPGRIAAAVARRYVHDPRGSAFASPDRRADWVAAAMDLSGAALSDHCRHGLGTLRNGHSGLFDAAVEHARGGEIGAYVRRLPSGEWVVIGSRRADLSVGEVVTHLDGAHLDAALRGMRNWVEASTEPSAAASLFFRPFLFPARFVLRTAEGRCVRIARGADPLRSAHPRPPVTFETRSGIRILAVNRFDGDAEAEALTALTDLPTDAALVIDLRWNGGGATPFALLARLHPDPFPGWRYRERGRGSWGPDWGEGPPEAHRGPIALLVGPLTASAAEDIAMPLQWTGRAVLFGEPTAGSTGEPHIETLAPGLGFRVAAREARFPDGRPFEGRGLRPDVPVAPDPEAVAAGRDPVLRAALEWLSGTG